MSEAGIWKRCSSCKEPIALGAVYWACNVSTCNRARTALHFCSVSCWDAHLPIARHRDAWAEERRAPKTAEPEPEAPRAKPKSSRGDDERPRRRIIADPKPAAPSPAAASKDVPEEVLVIASRLKDFVRAESGFNTSDRVLEPLSAIVRRVAREAIANARADGRKTVLDRDVPRS